MKYLITTLLALITLQATAQKDFEGVIRYKLISPEGKGEDRSDTFEIKIHFAPGRLLLKTTKEREKEDILVILDSAKTYELNKTEKTYRAKRLTTSSPFAPAGKEMVEGYTTTPLQISGINWIQAMGRGSTLWFADSLFFHIPANLEGNEELMMIDNNRILLKATIRMDDFMSPYTDENEMESGRIQYEIKMTAIEVIPGTQPPSLFMIPDDYKKRSTHSYSIPDTTYTMMDTAIMLVDTTAMTPSEPPPPPRKTPVKPPVKTKNTNKAPVKKED